MAQVLRVEKGFAALGEFNGQTSARDFGLSRKRDYIGRATRSLPALTDPERSVLVSFASVNRRKVLTAGSHSSTRRCLAIWERVMRAQPLSSLWSENPWWCPAGHLIMAITKSA